MGPGGDVYSNERKRLETMGGQFAGRQAPMMDLSGFNQLSGDRAGSLDMLRGAAMGTAPSAADLQMQNALGRAQAGAYSMAQSIPGASPGMAMRMAQQQAGGLGLQYAQQAAMLRAKEQEQARQAFMQALMGYGGQQLGIAGANQNAAMQQTGLNDAQFRFAMDQSGRMMDRSQQSEALRMHALRQASDRDMQLLSLPFDVGGQIVGKVI